MFYLVVSATLALAYGSVNAIIGLVLSVIAYAAVNAVLVRHAIRTGLSVSLFSRILLGRTGAAIATLISSPPPSITRCSRARSSRWRCKAMPGSAIRSRR